MNDPSPAQAPKVPLRCHGLRKRFDDRAVLDGIDLEVGSSERVALLGSSGEGKSTLLHCLSGASPFDEGEVYLDGAPLSALSEDQIAQRRRESIGVIFQFFHLLPTLTAYENIELPLQLNGVSPDQRRQRIESLMKRLGIAHRAQGLPATLSGGEKQRVAIARAIAHRPKILFADEPTGNLDHANGEAVLEILRQITTEEKAALLLVTHSDEAAAICDRQLVLRDGIIHPV